MLLPGRPKAKLQAVCSGEWQRKRIIVYISGNALAILGDVDKLIQTIYHDHALTAVAFDESTGKIAACADDMVYLYRPNGRGEGYLKWSLQTHIYLDASEDGTATTVTWGSSEELIVGSKSLALWATAMDTSADARLLWRRRLANPAKLALFSHDSSLVASIAEYDKLVKVWWKVLIGSDGNQFDFSYLLHPRAVVWMQWRQPVHPEESADNVLYTLAKDNVLRVWAPVYPHDVHLLQLWTVLDLWDAIPRTLSQDVSECQGEEDYRHALIVDNKVFRHSVETTVLKAGNDEKEKDAMLHLVEVAKRSPDVVVVFDAQGRMSAWGLENVGYKTRNTMNMFNIVHTDNSGLGYAGVEGRFLAFAGTDGLVVLAHFFDGRICWLESRMDRFLDPALGGDNLRLRAVWTGHDTAVSSMIRTADGMSLLTSTVNNHHIVWRKTETDGKSVLERKSLLVPRSKVERLLILEDGAFLMTLHEDYVILWDARQNISTQLERNRFTSDGKMLCLLLLPEVVDSPPIYHVVAVDERMTGIAWEIRTPQLIEGLHNGSKQEQPCLRQLARFELGPRDDLLAIIPVEPVGWNAVLSDNLDMFSREVATTVSKSGLLRSWTVKVFQEDSAVKWLATSTVDTGIQNPSLVKSNSIRKVALVYEGRNKLTVWDSKAAQLEFCEDFGDAIRDLDWTSTPQSQSILAVGFSHRVLLLCQLRYDYLNASPAWAAFREISIQGMTPHPIGDSTWLHDGGLVVGSGNQLFLYPRKIEGVDEVLDSLHLSSHKSKMDDIFDIVVELNGPLPVYHPQFLQECILAGKTKLAEIILVKFYKELRNYHEEIGLDPFLDLDIETYYTSEQILVSTRKVLSYSPFFESFQDEGEHLSVFDESLASKLCELLTDIPIPHLTGPEQIGLAVIVESVAQVNKHRRSIDEFGAQYLLFFRQHILLRDKKSQDMSFREFNWALHSHSQEILVDLVTRNSQGKMVWPLARESGIFMWLNDSEAVKRQFEAIARNHYTQADEKNPVDCSLYYLALKKKNVLLGLWRMASWHKEQGSTMKFLANNFAEPRWKTAAKKNAYALLGKRRFEYAAAFFLLADSPKDAVNICFTNLKDLQLAVVIARVYEGRDDGPVLRGLLETKVLPHARVEGDRWLAVWAFWKLSRKDLAVRALLSHLENLINPPLPPPSIIKTAPTSTTQPNTRLFLLNDPALLVFYKSIREKTTTTLRGAEKISPEMEFSFVLHTARLYDRMGCDILALDLVRNWEFLKGEPVAPLKLPSASVSVANEAKPWMRRRGSITVDDISTSATAVGNTDSWKEGRTAPPKAVWEEPDLSWAF